MQLWQRLRGLFGASGGGITVAPGFSPAQLEESLILADAGLELAGEMAARLAKSQAKGLVPPGQERPWVEEQLVALFPKAKPVSFGNPHVVLVVGANGSGKTTTTAKLAARVLAEGGKPILAACDTFRAAAIAQLQLWGQRLGIGVIAQRPGADSGAVLFDALRAAVARGATHLFADTAGRLHTKHQLMEELAKLTKVAGRAVANAPHEVLLVMDATTGQNGLIQAREFRQHAGVTGLVVTKLDGTAKGGIVLAVARELGLPVRWLGVGEGVDDLLPFDAQGFVEALLGDGGHA
ncbi:MAG: signal recognition particle-docking protein FtsY [Thermoanaerobaculaceae bacterium]